MRHNIFISSRGKVFLLRGRAKVTKAIQRAIAIREAKKIIKLYEELVAAGKLAEARKLNVCF